MVWQTVPLADFAGNLNPDSVILSNDLETHLLPREMCATNRRFMAPEQREGDAPTQEGDMYALGALLLYLVHEEHPVPFGDVPDDALDQHLEFVRSCRFDCAWDAAWATGLRGQHGVLESVQRCLGAGEQRPSARAVLETCGTRATQF